MKTNRCIEPRDWDVPLLRHEIEEWHTNTLALLAALANPAPAESESWWPHRHQMRNALQRYAASCQWALGRFGLWNPDELAPAEIHEKVWSEGGQLVEWLVRMVGSPAQS